MLDQMKRCHRNNRRRRQNNHKSYQWKRRQSEKQRRRDQPKLTNPPGPPHHPSHSPISSAPRHSQSHSHSYSHSFTHLVLELLVYPCCNQEQQAALVAPTACKHGGSPAILYRPYTPHTQTHKHTPIHDAYTDAQCRHTHGHSQAGNDRVRLRW